MRVLLYEPGIEGHRPVYLRYLLSGLQNEGIDPVPVTDPYYSKLGDAEITQLEHLAYKNGCKALHLLTIDGVVRQWWKPRQKQPHPDLKIFGSYYLFNNIRGAKGLAWLWAHVCGYIDHIFISDPLITQRFILPGIQDMVTYAPDTWCRAEFPFWKKPEARSYLGLSQGSFIFLVFGQISCHKGVHRILAAFKMLPPGHRGVLVLAGNVKPDARKLLLAAKNDPGFRDRLILMDGSVPEFDVSAYFYACDAVLCDYPKTFVASSGVFTRTIVSGATPVFPEHGIVSEIMNKYSYGIPYQSENVNSLSGAMAKVMKLPSRPRKTDILDFIESSETKKYCAAVAAAYTKK